MIDSDRSHMTADRGRRVEQQLADHVESRAAGQDPAIVVRQQTLCRHSKFRRRTAVIQYADNRHYVKWCHCCCGPARSLHRTGAALGRPATRYLTPYRTLTRLCWTALGMHPGLSSQSPLAA